MQLPPAMRSFINTMAKARGFTIPSFAEPLMDAEWTPPVPASGIDFHLAERGSYSADSYNGKVTGRMPDGARVTLLIQIEDLREVPEPLRSWKGGGGNADVSR